MTHSFRFVNVKFIASPLMLILAKFGELVCLAFNSFYWYISISCQPVQLPLLFRNQDYVLLVEKLQKNKREKRKAKRSFIYLLENEEQFISK